MQAPAIFKFNQRLFITHKATTTRAAVRQLVATILLISASNSSFVGATVSPLPKNSAPWVGDQLTGGPCTGKGQGFGPYDYTRQAHRGEPLRLVEGAHFKPRIRALIEERGRPSVMVEIDYTLRAFPNHHQALYAMTQFWFLPKSSKRRTKGLVPPECYFQRAINFKKNDGIVKMLYGLYLHKINRYTDAKKIYLEAEKLLPKSAQIKYNIGLLYYDTKRYTLAKKYAVKAYAAGHPLPGLRKKLEKAGYWP